MGSSHPSGYDVRAARLDDHEAVAAFTADTWSDRGTSDYIPEVFPSWIEDDGDGQRTFVATTGGGGTDGSAPPRDGADGEVVGLVQAVVLSEYEAWFQGMRVHPDHRGQGVSAALNEACFGWARERGAAVGRLMIFSWNVAALAAARASGFEPGTEFRWADPEPDADAAGADGAPTVRDAPADAYARWADSRARDHLGGVGLDLDESWACSSVDLATLRAADRTFAVGDERTRAVSYRVRTSEREDDEGDVRTWAEYGVGAWADLDACRDLMAAVGRDAAAVGADRTRVLIPETARHVSDAARAGADLSEEPDFVLDVDLTGR